MPGVTVAHLQGNHPYPQSRHLASMRTTLAGQILWLPRKEELRIDGGLEDGCYNHPVVVLSPGVSNGNVVILILTSLKGVDLSTKHARNIRARLAHLPIKPCSPHPDNGILLLLKGDTLLQRNTYIKTENQYTLPFSILRSYDRSGESFVLTNDSYQKLIHHANFIPVTSLNINLRLHPLEDEGHRLYWDGSYETMQNTPYTQHRPSRSHGNFTNDARYAQHSRHDTWSNPGSSDYGGTPISDCITILIFILCIAIFGAVYMGLYRVAMGPYWVAMQVIKAAKGAARSAWDWIRDVSRGL